jgi:protein-L-isoaspartate(D-aspartate) O-methyltransferase
LAEKGEITSRWAEAMRGVPRHLFLPTVIYRFDRQLPGNDMVPVHRDTDLEQWLRRAYTNAPVTTQVDDGHPPPDGIGWEVTSSCSQPSVVAGMLEELQLEPGMRVLEIGTGTGWNAALLASVAGGANVTSIEIDPAVAARAHAALTATGHDQITLIVGDGALGWPDAAPYDRVIATVGSVNIPYPWIAQTRPGGRVIAPVTNHYHPAGLARLIVAPDATATGTFGAPVDFMDLRAQRHPRPRVDTSARTLTPSPPPSCIPTPGPVTATPRSPSASASAPTPVSTFPTPR